MILLLVAKMLLRSFLSSNLSFLPLWSLLSFLSCSEGSAIFLQNRTKYFFLVNFAFLGLNFLQQDSFAVVPYVSTFEVVNVQ